MIPELFDAKRPPEYAAEAIRKAQAIEWSSWWHRHREIEFFYDLRADKPGGPRTYHGIGWACACGRVEYGKGCSTR